MKNLNFLRNLFGPSAGRQSNDISVDRRLTVGSLSGFGSKSLLKFVSVLTLIFTLGVGSAWGVDYILTTDLTEGDYVIGAVKGSAGTDTHIYAFANTDNSSWAPGTETTPSSGKISDPASSIVWHLTPIGNNGFSLQNGTKYLTIGTGTGSGSVRYNSTSPGTIYFAATGSNSTYEISGVSSFTVSSGNQVGYNIGSGYRQYAQRTHSTSTSSGQISVQFRFYKKASAYTVTLKDDNSTLTEASPGAGVTLPSRTGCTGYTFVGWTASWTEEQDEWTQIAPAVIPAGSYSPSANVNLYPVYRKGTGAASATITTTLTAGKQYVFGAVKAAASTTLANNTAIGAIGFTGLYSSTSWGQYTTYTPNTSGVITASIGSAYIWTLESISSGKYSFKNNNNASYPYIYLNTSTGSNQAGLNTTGQVYLEDVSATCKDAFKLHPGSSNTNKLLLNTGNNYGYRMYGSSQGESASMCPYIRFYEYNIDYYYISVPSCGASCTAPTGLATETISSTSIQVTITDPANTGTYEIYYNQSGTAPTSGTGASATVNTTTPNITGLASGETYYMWVRAKCGESSKSDWVALTGSTFTTTCGDPSSTSNGATTHATTGGNGTQVLNWSGDPSNYEIYYHGSSTAPSPSQDPSRTVNGAKTETITGLTPGTYYWWVRSKCSSGKGDWVAGPSFTINGIKIGGTIPVAFGTVGQGSSVAPKTITVTGVGLTSGTNITASFPGGSPFSIDPTSVAHNADHVTLTISASTANVGAYDQNLTLSYGGTYTATVKVTMTVVRTITYSVDGEENAVISADGATLLSVLPVSPESCDDTNYPTFYGWATSPINGSTTTPPTIVTTEVVNATTAAETYYAVFAKGSQYWGRLTSSELSGLSAGTELVIVAVDQGYVLQNDLTCSNSVPAETDGKISPTDNIKWTLAGSAGAWQLKSGTDILGTQYNSCAGSGNGVVLAFNLNHQTYSIASSSHATNEFYIKDNACDYGVLTKVSKYDDIRIVNVSSYSSVASAALKLYIKKGSYSEFITNCCSASTLAFAASPYATIRQDIGGASTTTWAEVDVTFTSNNTTGTISATTYTDGKTVYKLSSWEGRGTTGGTLCANDHAYFEVLTQPSGETPGTGKFHVKTTSGQTGQGTYRIAITQAATDESHGNFCETTVYGFVDVTLRDKFVDNVNGNGTINRDGHGAQLATPTLSEFGTQVENACHEEGRKLKGWIKETDLKAQYETGSSTRVQTVDGLCETCADGTDQTSLIVAPGANVTMSGATWYAVWAYER